MNFKMYYQSLYNEANNKQKYKFSVMGRISLCVKGIFYQTDLYLEVYTLVIKSTNLSLETMFSFSLVVQPPSLSLSSIPRKKNEASFYVNGDSSDSSNHHL